MTLSQKNKKEMSLVLKDNRTGFSENVCECRVFVYEIRGQNSARANNTNDINVFLNKRD